MKRTIKKSNENIEFFSDDVEEKSAAATITGRVAEGIGEQ